MSKNTKQITLYDLDQKNSVIWSYGNYPTQLCLGLDQRTVENHLKASFLLSEKVLCSASYLFESELTLKATIKYRKLFTSGYVSYFIDEGLEDAEEHGIRKHEKSPRKLRRRAYRSRSEIKDKSNIINGLGVLIKRPDVSISNTIVTLWERDVISEKKNSIGALLSKEFPNQKELYAVKKMLISYSRNRSKDFVWEFIYPYLLKLNIKKPQTLAFLRRRLTEYYHIGTSRTMNIPNDFYDYHLPAISSESKKDSALFLKILSNFNLLNEFSQLIGSDILALKNSQEFISFKAFYCSLIEAFSDDDSNVFNIINLSHPIEKKYLASNSYQSFITTFISFAKIHNIPLKQFAKPLDILRANLDMTMTPIVDGLAKYITDLGSKRSSNEDIKERIVINRNEYRRYRSYCYKLLSKYILFIVISLILFWFSFDGKMFSMLPQLSHDKTLEKNILRIVAILLFAVTFIRPWFDMNKVKKALKFVFSKKERNQIKQDIDILEIS